MKRTLKILLSITLVALMSFSLNGCILIDKLREQQAFYTESGDLIYNGKIYSRIYSEYILDNYVLSEPGSPINVTSAETPVLLSFLGDMGYISPNGIFISFDSSDSSFLFCHEDYYEDVIEFFEKAKTQPDNLKYYYPVVDHNAQIITNESYTLSQEEFTAVINASKEGSTVDESQVISEYFSNMYYSSDTLNLEVPVFDVYYGNGDFYIGIYDENAKTPPYYTYIKVPEKYNDAFERIFSKAKEYIDEAAKYSEYYEIEDPEYYY